MSAPAASAGADAAAAASAAAPVFLGADGQPLECSHCWSVQPPPSKADPFPHLRKHHIDSIIEEAKLDARDAAAGGAQPIEEEEYTAEQRDLMEQLRSNVAAMIADPAKMVATAEDYPGGMHQHWTTYWPEGRSHPLFVDNVSQLDADPARWSDNELIRFLRARNMDLKKATKMYFNYKRWRLVYGASHIATLPSGPWEPLISSILSASYHKWDRHGRPLYIQKTGLIDVNRFAKEVSSNRIGVGHTWFTEQMKRRMEIGSRLTHKRVDKLVMILDIKGLGLSARKMMKFFQITSFIDQNFLPESMGCMYIVNSPSFFPVIWSLAKAFLSAETQKKIKILGGPKTFADTIVRDLGADCLPKEYGGDCECEWGCCPVPSGVAPYMGEGAAADGEGEEGEEETVSVAAGYAKTIELPVLGSMAASAVAAAAQAAAAEGDAQADDITAAAAAGPEEAFWSLSVSSRDVDFSVHFHPSPEGDAADDADPPAPIVVVPVTRVSADDAPLIGAYSADRSGVLHFKISNEYSRWHGKTATIRTGTRAKVQ